VTAPPSGRTAFAAALSLLTGRALTTGELVARLERRGFDAGQIAEAGSRAAALGLLDDRRTAAAWTESAVAVRGFGPRRVREGLARRLLDRELVEEVVAEAFGPGEEAARALAALGRWERAKGPASDEGRRRAAYAHLLRRGFSSAAARAALFNRAEIE
jgi:SOS response regulatory protein OraA/RecX